MWTHPSVVVTQFTISCAVELLRLVTSDDIMTSLLIKLSISIKRALILFIQTLALYKSFTYLPTYLLYVVKPLCPVSKLSSVDRIRRQSSWAGCELCSFRRRRHDATRQLRHVGGVYWALEKLTSRWTGSEERIRTLRLAGSGLPTSQTMSPAVLLSGFTQDMSTTLCIYTCRIIYRLPLHSCRPTANSQIRPFLTLSKNELIQWRGVRRLSVCKLLRKSLLLADKWPDRYQTFTQDGLQVSMHHSRVCSRSRSMSKARDTRTFLDSWNELLRH